MTEPAPSGRYGTCEWFEGQYAKGPADPWGLTWRPSQRLRYLRALAALGVIDEPLPRVLDVGCATGEFTHLLSRRVGDAGRVLGVDFSPAAVERARLRFPGLTFAQASIASVGATYRGHFDLVACMEVLYYVASAERSAAIRALRDTVRDDGYALVSSFVGSPPYFRPDELLELVASEFDIVRWELLHLRAVSVVERLGDRLTIETAAGRDGWAGQGMGRRMATLPWPAVVAIERWSGRLGSRLASHIVVLARACARRT
jgi:SAM-dependent methyltransferase